MCIRDRCSTYLDSAGECRPLPECNGLSSPGAWMAKMSFSGFRVISMCFQDYESVDQLVAACRRDGDPECADIGNPSHFEMPDRNLTLFGVVAIHDQLRPEVPDAVAGCHTANVRVVMVTGDAKPTAMFVSKACGIFSPPAGLYPGAGHDPTSGVAIEAPVFRRLYDAAFLAQPVSYTHLRAHETPEHLVCRLLLEKKKKKLTDAVTRYSVLFMSLVQCCENARSHSE
eukprot:TRINITY_DN14163_c0_g2_i16.p1 TRINITY_DN14163_c0_g2~~TRINITY_DN14163_c0_g2_i16.p1  ORF type:complete len:228 (-),score=45.45 TRINITY_DN14163_c0_g2_i16:5-688(-)